MALYVETRGHGPDVVLIHGWGLHGGVWGGVADALAAHYRLHLVDLPGHGRSPYDPDATTATTLAARVAAVVPERAHWVGWSLGALVALAAAAHRPERLRRLALVAGTPCFVQRPDWSYGMPAAQLEAFGHELVSDFRGTLNRFLALQVHGSETEREDLRRLRELVFARGEPGVRALREALDVLRDTDLRPWLGDVAAPTRWLMGGHDRVVPVDAAQAAARHQPHADVEVLPKAGHAPFLSHPRAFADRLTPFLEPSTA